MAPSHHSAEFIKLRLKAGLSRLETADYVDVLDELSRGLRAGSPRPSRIAIKWLQEHIEKARKAENPSAFTFIDLFCRNWQLKNRL